MVEDGWIYLWGEKCNRIYLGRVAAGKASIPDEYQAWDGSDYVADRKMAVPVLQNMAHGGFHRSCLFKPSCGWKYMFIGVSGEGTSKVLMSVATRLEGPWIEFHELFTAEGIDCHIGYKYCVYGHPWAFGDGELLVTWSEHWPGGVVAGKVTFEMEDSSG